jgi:hypothetical protein
VAVALAAVIGLLERVQAPGVPAAAFGGVAKAAAAAAGGTLDDPLGR